MRGSLLLLPFALLLPPLAAGAGQKQASASLTLSAHVRAKPPSLAGGRLHESATRRPYDVVLSRRGAGGAYVVHVGERTLTLRDRPVTILRGGERAAGTSLPFGISPLAGAMDALELAVVAR